MRLSCFSIFALLLSTALQVHGFSPSSIIMRPRHSVSSTRHKQPRPLLSIIGPFFGTTIHTSIGKQKQTRSSITALGSKIDGTETGKVMLGFVLAICVWTFSIPVEFRRARLCSEADAAVYSQCKSASQYVSGISEYYQKGGGIQFDFSIDPNTLADNEELRQSLNLKK
jgi:hypothetical protein